MFVNNTKSTLTRGGGFIFDILFGSNLTVHGLLYVKIMTKSERMYFEL